jgi:hypothetical protein
MGGLFRKLEVDVFLAEFEFDLLYLEFMYQREQFWVPGSLRRSTRVV